jgi:hypothetical protein
MQEQQLKEQDDVDVGRLGGWMGDWEAGMCGVAVAQLKFVSSDAVEPAQFRLGRSLRRTPAKCLIL